jgi:hypothetical protein
MDVNNFPKQLSIVIRHAYISKEEIWKCIHKLRIEKACGEDEIINECIKSTSNKFINIYEKLFNIIFDKGLVPYIWLMCKILTSGNLLLLSKMSRVFKFWKKNHKVYQFQYSVASFFYLCSKVSIIPLDCLYSNFEYLLKISCDNFSILYSMYVCNVFQRQS